jgi:hypothetical protein
MFCPKCGTNNGDNTRFCFNCGYALSAPQQPNQQLPPLQQPNQYQQQLPPLRQPNQYQQQLPPLRQTNQFQQMPPLQQAPYGRPYVQPKKSKAGVVIAVIAIIVVFGLLVAALSNGWFSSAPVIKKACVATALDPETYEPLNRVRNIPGTEPTIYVAAYIQNVNQEVSVVSVWYHLDSDESFISDYIYIDYDAWFYFSLDQSEFEFPVGDYVVELYVDDYLEETVEFTIY